MDFTAELGTADSMPGHIALGASESEGEATGGPPPEVVGERSVPQVRASASLPQGS